MRIALVHDWLMEMGDREKTFLSLVELFPGADIFTLVYNRDLFDPLMSMKKLKISSLQAMPYGKTHYLSFFFLYWELMGRLDLSEYDLVVSSSAFCAKWIRTSKNTMHVCYCHTPGRAIWGLQDSIFKTRWFSPSRWPGGLFSGYLKWCDRKSNQGVTHFMASSTDVKGLIQNLYERNSEVFFPPIETERFQKPKETGEYFVLTTISRPSARDLKIIAVLKEQRKPLLVIVPEQAIKKWNKLTSETIQIKSSATLQMQDVLSKAKAFICSAEDVSIVAAGEALAAGCPLWVVDDVLLSDLLTDGETGLKFSVKNNGTILKSLEQFEKTKFNPEILRERANRFSKARFLFKTQVYFRRLFGIPTQVENENL